MAIPPTLLLRKLVLESLLSSGPFTIFFPIARCLPLVIPPSSPPEPNMLSFHKSPWARFLMQFRPPNTSIPSFPIQSVHRQGVDCGGLEEGYLIRWEAVGVEAGGRGVDIKGGSGDCEVWGRKDYGMGWEGVGQLAEVEGRMDGDQYVAILEDHLVPSIEESGIFEEEAIFQQDNDPKHTSKKAKKWMEDHNISLLDWPPQYLDLNPIEHLWKHIKSELTKYPTQPKGVWEIWERVAEVCQNLIESMPRRVQAVIKAKGGHTKY